TDGNPSNNKKDCDGANSWALDSGRLNPWVSPAADTVEVTPGQTGVVSLDVTDDVRGFLDGTRDNYGWILLTNRLDPDVTIGSRESDAPPRLTITTFCSPGLADCDDDPNNGCEASVGTLENCLSCGGSCDDQNPCTADACDSHLGCTHSPVADGI